MRHLSLVVAVLVALAALAGCTAPTDDVAAGPEPTGGAWPSGRPAAAPAAGARPVVVDTDLGRDDLLALAVLLSRTDVDVRAVTVVGTGLVRCEAGVPLALAVVESVAGRSIPVSCGREEVDGGRPLPGGWRDAADQGSGLPVPSGARPADARPAPDLIAAAIDDAEGAVTVLALGPMTNVADALAARPDLARSGATVHAMAGAVDVAGNAGPDSDTSGPAEWNVLADPAGFDAVLASGIPVTLVPLDATDGVDVDVDAVVAAASTSDGAGAALVAALLSSNPALADLPWWDVLAAVAWLDPELVVDRDDRPLVVRRDGSEVGRTVVDADGHLVSVVRRLDGGRALAAYLAGL